MNVMEIIKYKKSDEYKDYIKALENNKEDVKRFSSYHHDAEEKYNMLKEQGCTDLKILSRYENEMHRWEYECQKCLLKHEFIRPNNKAEIAKRNEIANNFGNDLMNIVGEDSDLRFHGTPIYYAKEIIKSGKISSTADRHEGYISSTDLPGYCSASSIKSINRTIDAFTDFASYQRSLPCGVLFVLKEKEGDLELRANDEMQNVDFFKNPEQLVGILCTDEVKDKVTKWCSDSQIDTNLVYTYDGFLEYEKNNNLENGRSL